MHMQSTQIDRYVSGRLEDDAAAAYATHLTLCLHCTERVARRTAPEAGWERRGPLGRLVRVA